MSDFPFVRRERVRFRDCDAFGHVNNAVYSTYLEELREGDELEVHSRCSRIGTKSLDLEHEIRVDGRIAAEAKSVLVGYDYAHGASVPLPEDLKARLKSSSG
jgi:acyl-CoA thioester hydrolase